MIKNKIVLIVLLCFAARNGFSQTCAGLGQNPGSAFPVCGTDTFSIASVPICGNRQVPGPCRAVPLTDKNPFWYKFTCFTSGTLGFVITPNTISDDYDWQIFDITNHNPSDVYTDASLFVACNWSGEGGLTGASSAGTSLAFCDGYGVPLFSSMPNLTQGHEYILLVSHFSDSQSGYSLSFGGGTANITDPVNPNLSKARAACDGSKISIKLNKKMKCSTLAVDGSDFSITPAVAPIISATGVGCTTNFDMDSIVITLGGILPPGNYTVRIETGTDGNNLLDNCNRGIPSGQVLPVTVFPVVETPMDSLSKVGCAPGILNLVFRDPIKCSSIAADGSDFIITGSTAISVAVAAGICNADGLTNIIQVKLATPIQQTGTFKIQLKVGSDGNTIINECGKETTPGAALPFITKDTVSALFTPIIHFGCVTDTIFYTHDGNNGVNTWQWNFDNTITSTIKDPFITYTVFGQKQATLIVSNGTCSDTATTVLFLDNAINALFESTSVVCPGDPATFIDQSTGSLNNAWFWDFGNGNVSTLQSPPKQFYPTSANIHDVLVRLIVTNSIGCTDTAINTIKVAGNCYIAIPRAFTPNGDGLNDFLYPTNAYKAKDLLFIVYNRTGQKIFESRDWTNKWDGTFKGNPQDPGTYVWLLSYTNSDTGQKIQQKGSTVLIR
jgi:gliding motility-associated-like protein